MPLTSGSPLGPYEITALLGSGGMGEVYRARDPRLGRDVAIKILPSGLSADPDRLHRFEQEARAAAALNHPNILAVYDIGQQPSIGSGQAAPYIVSELLQGETLRSRLASVRVERESANAGERVGVGVGAGSPRAVKKDGEALPVRRALEYAIQIAHGLAAAHEKGIVHRDLKPENLFVTSDGRVKILDFGLAKLTQAEPDLAGVSELPTTPPDTLPGLVLGTVGYMSPEQVRGLAADHRSDIFAFGAILYEMLSGQRAFRRETTAETMTAILKEDPPDLPLAERHIPPALERIVDRCVEKTPDSRFQSTKDLGFALEALSSYSEAAGSVAVAAGRKGLLRSARLAWGVAAAVSVAALALGAGRYFQRPPVDTRAYRSTILPPPDTVTTFDQIGFPGATLALSPNGRRLAFLARGTDGQRRLWVRLLEGLSAQPLAGTEGVSAPFWSPDSQFLAFFAGGQLKKIDAAGGPPVVLGDAPAAIADGPGGSGAWNRDGLIIFAATAAARVQRVSASGGAPSPVTTLDAQQGESFHVWPFFLPDGRHFLYLAIGNKTGGAIAPNGIYVASLDTGDRQLLLPGGSNAQYAQGHLLFLREQTLMAQPFDLDRLELAGEAVPIAQQVFIGSGQEGIGAFSVSETGALAYQTGLSGEVRSQLTWFDRSGKQIGVLGDQADYGDVQLSPDGTQQGDGSSGERPGVGLRRGYRAASVRDPSANRAAEHVRCHGRRPALPRQHARRSGRALIIHHARHQLACTAEEMRLIPGTTLW